MRKPIKLVFTETVERYAYISKEYAIQILDEAGLIPDDHNIVAGLTELLEEDSEGYFDLVEGDESVIESNWTVEDLSAK